MSLIRSINSGDCITIQLFGKEQKVAVFSIGDNQFDENGQYKDDGFALNDEEIACFAWL